MIVKRTHALSRVVFATGRDVCRRGVGGVRSWHDLRRTLHVTHAFAFRLEPLRCAAGLILIAVGLLAAADRTAAAENAAAADAAKVKLLVLDLELIGDLGGPELERTHAVRLRKVSDQLRSELAQNAAYEVVDATAAAEMIERLRGTQYLHKCNGCEIDIALQLGAEQVMVAWIHRVSQLILSLTYEIREVPSGRTLRRKSFDFRGDNDDAWSRAVSYMARDIAATFPRRGHSPQGSVP